MLLASDTIFQNRAILTYLALDVSSRHAYAGNLSAKLTSVLKNHLIRYFTQCLGKVLTKLQEKGSIMAGAMNLFTPATENGNSNGNGKRQEE